MGRDSSHLYRCSRGGLASRKPPSKGGIYGFPAEECGIYHELPSGRRFPNQREKRLFRRPADSVAGVRRDALLNVSTERLHQTRACRTDRECTRAWSHVIHYCKTSLYSTGGCCLSVDISQTRRKARILLNG